MLPVSHTETTGCICLVCISHALEFCHCYTLYMPIRPHNWGGSNLPPFRKTPFPARTTRSYRQQTPETRQELHDSTRRSDLQHSRNKALPQSPHPFFLLYHPHQPQRRRNLLPRTILHRRINLPSRFTHIKRLRHKRRKRPTQPPRRKRLFKKSCLPTPTERLVLFKLVT